MCRLLPSRASANAAAEAVAPPKDKPRLADLAPADRQVFDTVREWRAERAREEGVPPYIILTNRQLFALVLAKPASLTALGQIDGIGPRKTERYGAALLKMVNRGAATGEPS